MDKALGEALKGCGLANSRALCIAAMADGSGKTTKEIQALTDINPPVISLALRWMEENGWVESKRAPHQTRGPPPKVWSFIVTTAEVLDEIYMNALEHLNEVEVAVEQLGRIKRRYEKIAKQTV